MLGASAVSEGRLLSGWIRFATSETYMTRHDESAGRRRREFLKVAGGVATALVTTADALGQGARQNAAAPAARLPAGPPDRGLWATWYDLPREGREAYLNWLHGTYLPALLERPGYLWAAHYATREREGGGATEIQHTMDPKVGTGYHYILLVGAADADVFGNPTPSAINAALPEAGRKMVAMRVGERVNITTETGRCEGGAATTYAEQPPRTRTAWARRRASRSAASIVRS